MTDPRTAQAVSQVLPGSAGGQCRVVTPVSPFRGQRTRRRRQLHVTVGVSLDADTQTHGADLPDGNVDDLMVGLLAVTGGPSATDTGDPWTLKIATLASPPSPRSRFFAYQRTRTLGGNALSWEWTGGVDVAAAAYVVDFHRSGLQVGDLDFVVDTSDADIGTSYSDTVTIDGVALLVAVWSTDGATYNYGAAEPLSSTNPGEMGSAFGEFDLWLLRGSGARPINVTADSGHLKALFWFEIEPV